MRLMAIYRCRDCQQQREVPRRWVYHLGPEARCPMCGTNRLTKLKTPDRIDPKIHSVLNLMEHLAGGKLHHCRFCRIQFYDRRGLAAVKERVSASRVCGRSTQAPQSAA